MHHLKPHNVFRNREQPYFEKRAITLFWDVILRCTLRQLKMEFLERITDTNHY